MSRRIRSLALQRARFDDRAEEHEHKHKKAPSIRSFFDARPARLSSLFRAALSLLHAALFPAPRGIAPRSLAFPRVRFLPLRRLSPRLRAFPAAPVSPRHRTFRRSSSRIARSSARFSAFPHAFPHVKNASFAKILALGSGVKYNLFRRAVPSGQAGYELFHHGS